MKQKLCLLTCFGTLLAASIVSCSKDESFMDTKDSKNISLTVDEARTFFEACVAESNLPSNTKVPGLSPGNFTPEWNKATGFAGTSKACLNVPLTGAARFGGYFSTDYTKRPSVPSEYYYTAISQKLLVMKNEQGKMNCAVISIIPSHDCATRRHAEVGKLFNHGAVNSGFSGAVIYSSVEGNYTLAVNRFQKGVLTAAGALSADNYDKSIAAMNVLLGYTHIMKSVRRNPGVKSDEYSTWGTIYLDEAVVTAPAPNNDYYEDYPWYWNNYEYDYTWGNNNNDNNISGGGGGSYGSGGGGGGGGGGGNSQSPTASLWCTNFEISLGDSYNLSLLVYPFGMTQTVRYEILDNGTWYVLHDDYQSPLPLALKPGNFRLRADVHLSDGTHLVSNETSIKVQYPDVSAIKANAIVSSRMDAVWAETKNAASAAGRYEKGFWIYVDTRTGQLQYECESTITGDLITGCVGTHASIKPSTPRDDPARNPLTGGRYFIAFFHTHTPLTYCSEGSRQTGPSTSDISYHTGDSFSHIPGLLYDYVGATIVNYETGQSYIGIKAGHNINDAATIHTIGIDRRRTPPMQ